MWSAIRPSAARALRVGLPPRPASGLSLAVARAAAAGGQATVRPAYVRPIPVKRCFATTKTGTKTTAETRKKTASGAKKTTRAAAAAGKAKPKKKKAAAAAKPKPKPKKARKALTPEEKKKAELRELKQVALFQEPPKLPATSWLVFSSQRLKGQKRDESTSIGEVMRQTSDAFKVLSSFEVERLQSTAEENKLSNSAAYKAWVASHPPAVIDAANRARARLRRAFDKSGCSPIQDDRQPKRPATAYTLFTKARWATGEFSHMTVSEATKLLSQEWKSLSDVERQTYQDVYNAELASYDKEMESILGRTIRRSASPPA